MLQSRVDTESDSRYNQANDTTAQTISSLYQTILMVPNCLEGYDWSLVVVGSGQFKSTHGTLDYYLLLFVGGSLATSSNF